MADSLRPRIKAPSSAQRGELIEIKTLVSHPMESGQRKDKDGKAIPRKIINSFTCSFNGRPVFAAKLEPAISANPYLAFFMRATESGVLEFAWMDDDGSRLTATHPLTVG
jgi:sulfur-oxidizing protein SoxZ